MLHCPSVQKGWKRQEREIAQTCNSCKLVTLCVVGTSFWRTCGLAERRNHQSCQLSLQSWSNKQMRVGITRTYLTQLWQADELQLNCLHNPSFSTEWPSSIRNCKRCDAVFFATSHTGRVNNNFSGLANGRTVHNRMSHFRSLE